MRPSYRLPASLRHELARPFGPVVQTAGLRAAIGDAHPILAVGDVVSLTLLETGVTPKLFVCDYKTQRGRLPLGAGDAPAAPHPSPPPATAPGAQARPGTTGPRRSQGPVEPRGPAPLPDHHFRTRLGSWGSREMRVRSPAGTITGEAWEAVAQAVRSAEPAPIRIVVDGEEDLLGIPCFLEAPVGSVVLYGMPGQGVVVVAVTAPFQAEVRALLARFEAA